MARVSAPPAGQAGPQPLLTTLVSPYHPASPTTPCVLPPGVAAHRYVARPPVASPTRPVAPPPPRDYPPTGSAGGSIIRRQTLGCVMLSRASIRPAADRTAASDARWVVITSGTLLESPDSC